MTLTLHLSPDQLDRLQAEADRSGLSLTDYILRRLLGAASQPATDAGARLAAIDAAMGALVGSGIASEAFMREKHEEIERDEARWQERFGPHSA